MRIGFLLAAAAITIASAPVAAALPSDVSSPAVTAGESTFGLDVEFYALPDGDEEAVFAADFSYAPREWLEFAFEAEIADLPDAGPKLEGVKAQALLAPAGAIGGWRTALELEVSAGLAAGAGDALEAKLMAARAIGAADLLLNFSAERALDPEPGANVSFAYGARLETGEDVTVALEALGELGDTASFGFRDTHGHMLGFALGRAFGPLEAELGFFSGLSDAAPDSYLRLEVSISRAP